MPLLGLAELLAPTLLVSDYLGELQPAETAYFLEETAIHWLSCSARFNQNFPVPPNVNH